MALGPVVPLRADCSDARIHKKRKSEQLSFSLVRPVKLRSVSGFVADIGGGSLKNFLKTLFAEQLLHPTGNVRHLAAPFFSDDAGLAMWGDITLLPDYYQTRDEIQLLHAHGDEIVKQLLAAGSLRNGLAIIDLGAG